MRPRRWLLPLPALWLLSTRCFGGLVLLEDAWHFAAGTEIVRNVEAYSTKFGREGVPPYVNASNMSIGFLSVAQMKDICLWENHTDKISLDAIVTEYSIYVNCNHTILCTISSVWIGLNNGRGTHGYFHFSGIAGEFCGKHGFYAKGLGIDSLFVESFSNLNQTIRASLHLEPSDFTRMRRSWYFQLYSHWLLPLVALTISTLSVVVYVKLRARNTHTYTHILILVLNTIQGLALAFIHAVGCTHFLTDFCSNDLQIQLWTEFAGFTLLTDLLFVDLLQNVMYNIGNNTRRSMIIRPGNLYNRIFGACLVVSDIFIVTTHGYQPPEIQFIVGLACILALMGVLAYVVRVYSQLTSMLRASCVDLSKGKAAPIMNLAKRFDYYSRYTIVSSFGIWLSSVMFALGLYYTTYVGYFAHIMLLDICKLLNMYSQTMVMWPIGLPATKVSSQGGGRAPPLEAQNKYVYSEAGDS